jgi:hypothetical protein
MNGSGIDRRQFLFGMTALPSLARRAATVSSHGTRALILVWLDGGMSHIDTFDGKPESSPDIRGDLKSRPCAIDDVWLSEHLPLLAQRIDRCTLIRSLSHGEGNHDRGTHYLLTGHRPSPVLVHPSLGAIRSSLSDGARAVPAYVAIPDMPAYGGEGFLSAEHGPFAVGGDPTRPDFRVRDLDPPGEDDESRRLRDALDSLDGAPRSASERARDELVVQADRMSQDAGLRAAFDLRSEPAEVRNRYGRHRLGQSCLLARKLAAAGTLVTLVRDIGWDHHQGISRALSYGFPPKLTALDQSVATLIDDLDDSGLSDRVVVCVASEFGRTPRINPSGGRDHWPRAQSVLVFGAGIARGAVVGRTDPRGEEPAAEAVSPGDLAATLMTALRIDPAQVLRTADGRPVRLVESTAMPIAAALSTA